MVHLDSDKITRVPSYSGVASKRSLVFKYGTLTFSGSLFQVILLTRLRLLSLTILQPSPACWRVWALPCSLAATEGISIDFFSCRYLDVSVLCVRLMNLWIQFIISQNMRGVSPFGNLRIKDCLHLSEAYRSLPRPSSLPKAKASALCS